MEKLLKKLNKIKSMLNFELKPPKLNESLKDLKGKMQSKSEAIEAPKANQQTSKKDPKKVAEQLKNGNINEKPQIKKSTEELKITKNGQWYLK